jgi:phage-related protein
VGSSLKDLTAFPEEARRHAGFAISAAQYGGKHEDAKPWKGDGSGVYEVVTSSHGDAYRTIYTVRYARAVYVLHAFQKKSTRGVKTSERDKDLVEARVKLARQHYEEKYGDD